VKGGGCNPQVEAALQGLDCPVRIGAHTADAGPESRLESVCAAVAVAVAVAVAAAVARRAQGHVLAVLRLGSAHSCLFAGPGIGGSAGTAGAGLGSPSLEEAA
jgi:hypothetical protein